MRESEKSGFRVDAAKKMMWGRGETSPQGVANLMTADWLCIEHADGWVPVYSRVVVFLRVYCTYAWARARTCIDNVRIPGLQLARGRTMTKL